MSIILPHSMKGMYIFYIQLFCEFFSEPSEYKFTMRMYDIYVLFYEKLFYFFFLFQSDRESVIELEWSSY